MVGSLSWSCSEDDAGTVSSVDATISTDGAFTDGGADAADVGAADGSAPDAGSALERYCQEATDFLTLCIDEITSFCARAELEACTELTAIERPDVVSARAACGFPEACTTPPTFDMMLCVYQGTADLQPTSLQSQLARRLCDVCSPGEADCLTNHFSRTPPRDDGVAVVQGTGTSYLLFDDVVIRQLLDQCLLSSGEGGCYQSFFDCLERVTVPADVRAACAPVGPGD